MAGKITESVKTLNTNPGGSTEDLFGDARDKLFSKDGPASLNQNDRNILYDRLAASAKNAKTPAEQNEIIELANKLKNSGGTFTPDEMKKLKSLLGSGEKEPKNPLEVARDKLFSKDGPKSLNQNDKNILYDELADAAHAAKTPAEQNEIIELANKLKNGEGTFTSDEMKKLKSILGTKQDKKHSEENDDSKI